MAEFVRAQIFGTTFEITSRYVAGRRRFGEGAVANSTVDMPIFNRLGWELSDLSGRCSMMARIHANFAHDFRQLCKGSAYGTSGRG